MPYSACLFSLSELLSKGVGTGRSGSDMMQETGDTAPRRGDVRLLPDTLEITSEQKVWCGFDRERRTDEDRSGTEGNYLIR